MMQRLPVPAGSSGPPGSSRCDCAENGVSVNPSFSSAGAATSMCGTKCAMWSSVSLPGLGAWAAASLANADGVTEVLLSRPARNEIDFDASVARESAYADTGAGGAAAGGEVLGVDLVHAFVVFLEMGEKNACRHDVLQREVAAGQHALQVRHHLARLCFDAVRVGRVIGSAGERHLAGDEHPAVLLHGVTEGRHRVRGAVYHVEDRRGQVNTQLGGRPGW